LLLETFILWATLSANVKMLSGTEMAVFIDSKYNRSIVPLTSYPGFECCPSFSPDGNQVAFAWNGDKQDNLDLYIKLIGAATPLRLTTDPRPDSSPSWSPDGRWIAFLRYTHEEKANLLLIAPTGGPERSLVEKIEIIEGPEYAGDGLSWSPDGKWIAIPLKDSPSERVAIFAISVETGEMRRLTAPPPETLGDWSPAFSPDGRMLAFSRFLTAVGDLYLLPLSDDSSTRGEPKRLTVANRTGHSPVWTPDGREIIFISGSGHSKNLWRIAANSSSGPERLTPTAEKLGNLAISRQGHRLAFAQETWNTSIWRVEVPGTVGKARQPVGLIASTQLDHTPQYSPDGKRIAFASYRSGNAEIWVCDSDGSNAAQLTSMDGPSNDCPSWSPDGKRIVFFSDQEGPNEIYLINAQGGKPQRLTNPPANARNPSWSRDGQWIYFSSNRSGTQQIWKLPAAGGEAVRLTKNGGAVPIESFDGKAIYYLKNPFDEDHASLWEVPVDGGEEKQVLESVFAINYAVGSRGIYFMPVPTGHFTMQFFSFATGRITQVASIEKQVMWGFSVSPDERWILYPQVDQSGSSDIMLVENFR
jgi:Tol biopolymer transport system component